VSLGLRDFGGSQLPETIRMLVKSFSDFLDDFVKLRVLRGVNCSSTQFADAIF
jgi:hypothetical protein